MIFATVLHNFKQKVIKLFFATVLLFSFFVKRFVKLDFE